VLPPFRPFDVSSIRDHLGRFRFFFWDSLLCRFLDNVQGDGRFELCSFQGSFLQGRDDLRFRNQLSAIPPLPVRWTFAIPVLPAAVSSLMSLNRQ